MRIRFLFLSLLFLCLAANLASAQTASKPSCCTLTIVVHGMDSAVGNLGILIFNNPKGWPDDRIAALKDIAIPAQAGIQTVTIPNLPPGNYAIALIHDTNQNHKLDKNFIGVPKEQWGMSNNPHATIKAPPMSKASFEIKADMQVQIELQK